MNITPIADGKLKNLESVEDYNARKIKERKEREENARKTGVACPACGKELLWPTSHSLFGITLEYKPPTNRVALCSCTSNLRVLLEI